MKYINESTKQEVLKAAPGTVILLNAPVGSGKTSFCLNELWLHCRINRKKALLLVNRSALRGQLRSEILKKMKIPVESVTAEGMLEVDGLSVTSYQFLQQLLAHQLDLSRLRVGAIRAFDFDYVIADEIHYLMVDSMFSPMTGFLLRLPKAFPKAVRIYMSATMEPVRDIVLNMEEVIDRYQLCTSDLQKKILSFRYAQTGLKAQMARNDWELKRDVIELQAAEPDYSYFMPVIYDEKIAISQIVKERFSAGDKGKWLIFVDSKEQGRQMKENLVSSGIPASFISADRTENEDNEELEEIVNFGRFKCRVLLTTPVMDNGISIKDKEVTHVVISGFEAIQAIQQAGRIRVKNNKCKIELFICRHSAEFFNRRRFQLRKKRKVICTFLYGDEWEIKSALIQNGNDGLGQILFQGPVGEWQVNPLALTAVDYYILELSQNMKLAQADSDGYIERALSWFGLACNESSDMQKLKQMEATKKVSEFLDEKEGLSISGQVWEDFRRQLRYLYEEASGTILCSGHSDRLVGTAKIKSILSEFGYFLVSRSKIYSIHKGEEECI